MIFHVIPLQNYPCLEARKLSTEELMLLKCAVSEDS